MTKTNVYSWRLSSDLKSALQEAAREEGESVAELLERIARGWLRESEERRVEDEAAQRRLLARAMECVGTISGGDPDRSAKTRQAVRDRLARRRAG